MSAPPVDVTTPLSAAPHSLASLTDGEGQLTLSAFKALVRQALLLVRSGRTWPKSKTFNLEHDSRVDATKGASSCSGRLAKCGWHARSSLHSPGHSHSLKFHDFREGLAVDHAVKEQQYIHDIVLTDSLGKVQPPSALDGRLIKESRIELFHTGYNLPVLTGNRDFSQMFLTVEFKPVSKPMSDAHIDEILASLEGKGGQTLDEAAKAAVDNGLASFVNIQLPVKLDNCPEVPKEYVRAYYASVEMVRQTDDDGAEWWMAVQSDSSGRIPLMFQEMAMPSKVAPDVPLFIGWAKKDKEDKTSSNAV